MHYFKLTFFILSLLFLIACDSETNSNQENTQNKDTTLQSYTLFAPMQSTQTYLINESDETVHTWQSSYRPGLSVYLLENGELLRTGNTMNNSSTFAGSTGTGGIIEIIDWESNVLWSKILSNDEILSHHDVEVLPNGNILAIVWEAKSIEEALSLGRTSLSVDTLWVDAIYEICRASSSNDCEDGAIVWKWSIWEHLIQDEDSTIAATYNISIANAPDKIDLNYFNNSNGADWTHINSVDYNEETGHILLSVHNFNEYWIIDHNDSSKGLLYRAGNPAAYGVSGEQILYAQHDAQWIEKGLEGEGNILLFNNGMRQGDRDYSSVDEYCYDNEDCEIGELISTYSEGTGGDFFATNISGAQRLSSGNTLVCEGPEGRFFEYNTNNEIIWEYNYGQPIFRAVRYESNYKGLEKLEID